jgi:16S rRNA (cytidine1402-2'-O)-methyltransferase
VLNSQLIIIPTFISDADNQELSIKLLKSAHSCTAFIVENPKPARKFLKSIAHPTNLDEIELFEMKDKKHFQQTPELHNFMVTHNRIGLLSDAGSPCIADPGWKVVAYAHELGMRVISLAGPGAIMQAIAASGLNGQQFVFHGYLPPSSDERKTALKKLEKEAKQTGYTQLFIETPYRNRVMFSDALLVLNKNTRMCLALDINGPNEFISCRRVSDWIKKPIELTKWPCIFLIGN